MASQINPNSIDATYPIAGQDNNTQGFRNNFSAIKNNFSFAEDEITALQATAVIAGAGEVNNLDGAVLYSPILRSEAYTRTSLGNISGANTINYAAGSFQSFVATGNVDISGITNLPVAGNSAVITLAITSTAASNVAQPYTVTLPNISGVGIDNSGVIGLVGNTLSFPRSNTTTLDQYTVQLITDDNGASFVVNPINTFTQPLNASSEDLASTANVNLGVSDSYIITGGSGETATLPAGVNGQVKVLAMHTDGGGDMVVTVTNAAWGGAGTITFADAGDACTLKYINSKWFCIGNNGCAFA